MAFQSTNSSLHKLEEYYFINFCVIGSEKEWDNGEPFGWVIVKFTKIPPMCFSCCKHQIRHLSMKRRRRKMYKDRDQSEEAQRPRIKIKNKKL